uniref:Solute-binding protein family 3/N-terminal domain-containing protein n=1 Tax=Anopheles dirus TaxID=7168 RepID=A0A182NID9_9DIPT
MKQATLPRSMDHTLSPRLRARTNRCMNALPAGIQPHSYHHPGQRDEAYASLPGAAVPTQHHQPTPPAPLQVSIDSRTKPRALPPRVENWMANFLRKPARERVRWRSKLHELEPSCSQRPPAERAEQLIDVGTEDFVDWLNTLGLERSTLSTGVVKALFSIGTTDETSRALNIAPREIRAIPGQVALEWNLPQLALEHRIAQLLERDRMLAGIAAKRTAFGRALPQELRCGWTPDATGSADVERPDVPDDLMSLKRLFRDIWHLRSVKYLVDYLTERPALPKPRFLQQKGLFQRQDAVEAVPFYRKVLSQKAIAESIRRFVEVDPTANFGSMFNERLNGLLLRVAFTESKPYSYLTSQNHLTGLDIDIMEMIADMLDVDVDFTLMGNLQFRVIEQMLHHREMDMYATRRGCNYAQTLPLLHLYDRSKVRLLMPKSQRTNFNLQFLKPFKPEVWYVLLALLLVGSAITWLFRQRMTVNVMTVIMFDHNRDTSRLAAVLVVVLQFLKFILLEAYLGQVTSFMIRLRYQENPQTLEQFFDSNVVLNAPVVLNAFLDRLPATLSVRMKEKLRSPQGNDTDQSYEPGYAYIVTEYASDTLKNEFSYDSMFNSTFFYVMEEPLYEFDMCYMFGSWSKFAGKFAECLVRLYETGVMHKLTGDAWRLANKALMANSSTLLVFPDLVPVFLFLCYGLIVSVLFFAGEILVQHVGNILIVLTWDIVERAEKACIRETLSMCG